MRPGLRSRRIREARGRTARVSKTLKESLHRITEPWSRRFIKGYRGSATSLSVGASDGRQTGGTNLWRDDLEPIFVHDEPGSRPFPVVPRHGTGREEYRLGLLTLHGLLDSHNSCRLRSPRWGLGADRHDIVHDRLPLSDFMTVGPGDDDGEGDTSAVHQDVSHGPVLSPIRWIVSDGLLCERGFCHPTIQTLPVLGDPLQFVLVRQTSLPERDKQYPTVRWNHMCPAWAMKYSAGRRRQA
jgi:hypothetical protein